MRHLVSPLVAVAICSATLLFAPGNAVAQPDVCAPGFELLPNSILCTPAPGAQAAPAPAQATPAPAPHRSLLDRILHRNPPPAPSTPPAPATHPPAPANPAPPPSAPPPAQAYNPPPTTAPAQSQEPPVVPLVILPAPGFPLPAPSERTVWLHTCVDLYVANNHLLQVDNQALDVPDLAYVLFQCSTAPTLIPLIPLAPVPVVPGQPPAAGNQNVFTTLPVTG